MGFFSNALKGFASSLPIVGDVMSQESRSQASAQEYERQKEFAQNGLRWKVADAKAAGIHPIFAVGANTPTYSPQAAIGSDFGLSSIGQNIGRAIEAGQTRYERAQANAIQARMGDAQIGLIDAQTDYYRALAAKASSYDETLDPIGRAALGSNVALRSQTDQRSKPIPTTVPTDVNKGFDKATPRYDFEFGLNGKRVAIAHSQTMHDKYEDMFLAEYWPVALGLVADARFKLTREPVLAEDGKWYAYNGSFYAPIDINTYRYEWENSVINRARGWFSSKHYPYRAGAGVNSHAGGGGV